MPLPLRIGLDFDGVIADCTHLKIERARELYQVELPPHRAKEYMAVADGLMTREEYRALMKDVCGTREVGLRMRAMDEGLQRLKDLQKQGHDLCVITSREGEELSIAQEWCARFGLQLNFFSTGYGRPKTEAAQGMDMYVDDDLPKLLPLVPHVRYLFLFSWHYNLRVETPDAITRVNSWDDIMDRVGAMPFS